MSADQEAAELSPAQQRIRQLSRELIVVGVTGTKGKTTTTALLAHLLNEAGVPAACTTTVGTQVPGDPPGPSCTTQELLLALLERSRAQGVRHVVLETTSYALEHGLAGYCRCSGGVFTNLGHDHLNIHGDREHYLQAKGRLFASLGGLPGAPAYAWAVLNAGDPASAELDELMAVGVSRWLYGLAPRSGPRPPRLHFQALRRRAGAGGSRFLLRLPDGRELRCKLQLHGIFNVANALAALAAGYCLGLAPAQMQLDLETFRPPAGRFEVLPRRPRQPLVIVDYAHTPESLAGTLAAARRLAPRGRLWTVFGCGGETDPGKRPLMGQVAARGSDCVVLTSDNPRREDPAAIIGQIMAGCRGEAARLQIEFDRGRAIAAALAGAAPGDVVVIAGKGHEREQILGDRVVPFSDRDVALALLRH